MKNGRREIALVASGIILGASIAAPVAGAALTAQESMQQIYVDGKLTQMEAYSISGHNYCKLRDIGQAVGFAVDYDPATNTVRRGIRGAKITNRIASCRWKPVHPAGRRPHPVRRRHGV